MKALLESQTTTWPCGHVMQFAFEDRGRVAGRMPCAVCAPVAAPFVLPPGATLKRRYTRFGFGGVHVWVRP